MKNGRREYLFPGWADKRPGRPITLDTLVNVGLVLDVDGKPYPHGDWMADAWRRLADARDQANTNEDARYAGRP